MSRATALPPKLDRRFEALVLGFGGARPRGEVLELDPRLAADWGLLELRLRFRAAQLRVRVSANAIEVTSDQPTLLSVAGADPVTVGPSGHRWERP
jgi:trehalose/maltose hydrolase-like predicted phosphorylase